MNDENAIFQMNPIGYVEKIDEKTSIIIYEPYKDALRNIEKYASANEVSISLTRMDDSIYGIIRDDGRGFDIDNDSNGKGLGLISMRERIRFLNGHFTIYSKINEGTVIEFQVPLSGDKI